MRKIVIIFWIMLIPVFAQPPQWSSEQTALWEYMKASWEDDIAKNGKWPAEYTVNSYVAWGDKNPGPIDRDSSIDWNRVTKDSETILWYRITPIAIVVEGDTAVLMYFADTLAKDKKGMRSGDPHATPKSSLGKAEAGGFYRQPAPVKSLATNNRTI